MNHLDLCLYEQRLYCQINCASFLVILGGIPNPKNRKLLFVVSLGDDAVNIGLHAGKLINEIARICSGGGGGKPNFAQAGAKDIDKLSDAIDYAKNYLQKTLDNHSDK